MVTLGGEEGLEGAREDFWGANNLVSWTKC